MTRRESRRRGKKQDHPCNQRIGPIVDARIVDEHPDHTPCNGKQGQVNIDAAHRGDAEVVYPIISADRLIFQEAPKLVGFRPHFYGPFVAAGGALPALCPGRQAALGTRDPIISKPVAFRAFAAAASIFVSYDCDGEARNGFPAIQAGEILHWHVVNVLLVLTGSRIQMLGDWAPEVDPKGWTENHQN